jgi:hypothetical protein
MKKFLCAKNCWLGLLAMGFGLTVVASVEAQQNSTRKIRIEPNPITRRIGSAIKWEKDFEAAKRKSVEQGKPIFWYVPTLPNTFMDRKTEIDRYMLSGPFSWPAIIQLINEESIPLRAIPTSELQKQFNLLPYEYVEPGFLVLRKNQPVFKLDRLTTYSPSWLLGLMKQQLAPQFQSKVYSESLQSQWNAFAAGQFEQVQNALGSGKATGLDTADLRAEAGLLLGMSLFRQGQQQQARQVWKETAAANPDHPLGWKCSAEAQMIGPFSRGFEIHRTLPAAASRAGIDSIGSAAPENCYDQESIWRNSVQFLLTMQDQSGGFFDSDYDFGGTDSLPNVHVAVTSLAGLALIDAWNRETDQAIKQRLGRAIDRALQYVTDDQHVNKIDRDEILWAYAYRLRLVARCLANQASPVSMSKEDLQEALGRCTAALESVQSRRGTWYHEYSNPFVTATALLALSEAKSVGAQPSIEVLSKGTAALAADRFGNGAYPYSSSRQRRQPQAGNAKAIAASAGRMPVCELALLKFDLSDQEQLVNAIEKSFALHGNLDQARKYDNHTSNLAYGGFFFWYDMRGRSEAIAEVADAETRQKFQQQQLELILKLPELDGCFIDSHELGRVYGTAMGLLSLSKSGD